MAATATVTPVAGEQDWGALVDEYETNIVTESLEKKVEQLDVNKNAPAAATAATAAPTVAAEEAPAAAPSDEQVRGEKH
jgi:ribosomal protein L12E/L44/L45/RPP1/RPP2